ncbi:hypothetical protein B9T33_14885 [Acinetobacter sp. ANC 5054]|uniref:hypothetical protein n=1 Tax=Acinetobacter sp. ANC 5054 TaxID=1977877 RepID=UPI000A33DC99|nr:hypothetical protein [Acinetobacter sp. ANC 5054]OTG77627.1 hypothetical protein B9T33_14885 [Acinetobacter sp. ANC 5054]
MNGVVTVLDSIPESSIAITVYLGGAAIALLCWYGLMKRIPKPFGGIGWLLVFAILLTPTVSEGTNASIAPAIFGLIFGVLTKDQPLVWANLSLIMFVVGIGLVLGYFWSKYTAQKPQAVVNKKTSPL